MKVSDLIEKLQGCDPDDQVIFSATRDLAEGHIEPIELFYDASSTPNILKQLTLSNEIKMFADRLVVLM